ncbi:YdeI/OmpD-associated family protein [Actinoplanes sichuanensis]|uniref:YdeI/OmpD-associated family protein n=1 Tax=Actinoplanes sichuanensis TaxID=512349 RepID=A0ABW4A1G5_9ACTN|nr:YdeI/OmpD-associated family protein [Actinoplanes sichuanensis]
MPIPADVKAALDATAQYDTFTRRRPAARRQLLQPIEDAAHQPTRQRRIEALVTTLLGPTRPPDPS